MTEPIDPIEQIARELSLLKDGPYRPLREAIADALRAQRAAGEAETEARKLLTLPSAPGEEPTK